MTPYVSIDIETTGLADNSEILQIAAIYDDGETPVDELETINIVIGHESYTHAEPYALMMNAALIEKIAKKEVNLSNPYGAILLLVDFLNAVSMANGEQKVILAGKNLAIFDVPMIRNFITRMNKPKLLQSFDKVIHYKMIDPGSMYVPDFGKIPSLDEINKITGRNEVTHDALSDAMDVVYAIRHKIKEK